MNEYEKKAKDFLESTGTGLTVEYDQHGKHFPDDKEPAPFLSLHYADLVKNMSARLGSLLQQVIKNRVHMTFSLALIIGTAHFRTSAKILDIVLIPLPHVKRIPG